MTMFTSGTSNDQKKAYGRCERCLRFMYGYQDTAGFHPGDHDCQVPSHGGYEPGVEESIKDPKPKKQRKRIFEGK